MRKFRIPDQWRQIWEDQQQSGLTISSPKTARNSRLFSMTFFRIFHMFDYSTAMVSAE
ncbi:MAG: hypothetical protein MK088_15310 [Alteromonas sp.]|nr:hypothetical protein [Alteromonas sp.]